MPGFPAARCETGIHPQGEMWGHQYIFLSVCLVNVALFQPGLLPGNEKSFTTKHALSGVEGARSNRKHQTSEYPMSIIEGKKTVLTRVNPGPSSFTIFNFRLTIVSCSFPFGKLRAGCVNLCFFVAKFLTGLQDSQALNIEYRMSNVEGYRFELIRVHSW